MTGVAYTPVTQQDGPALSTTKTRENANTQNLSPTPSMEGEGTVDDQYTTHNNDSNREGTAATRTALRRRLTAPLRRMERTQTVNKMKMEAAMFLVGGAEYGPGELNIGIIRNG